MRIKASARLSVLRALSITALSVISGVEARAQVVFSDNFDNSFPSEPGLVGSVWPKWPNATDHMNAWNNMNHTPGGTTSIRQDPEDPATLANYHDFGAAAVAVTATAWLFDNNSRLGVSAFPINFYVGLYGDSVSGPTASTDYLLLGLAPPPTFADYNTYGYRTKSGGSGNTSVTRSSAIAGSADGSGWIKMTIHADSLAAGGHVSFYINDVLVGTSSRQPGVSLRYFFMGSQSKNYEFFWFDDVNVSLGLEDTNPPAITSQPQSVTANVWSDASFSVTATSTMPLNYQWSLNGTNISGATGSSVTISNVAQNDLGAYAVVVTNSFGSVTSSNAMLLMYPYIYSPFMGAVAYWGKDATLGVSAWGTPPLSYQWFRDGIAIANATNRTLTLTSIQFTNAGLYSVVVNSPLGSVTNTPAQVVVNPAGVSFGFSPTLTIDGVIGYSYVIQSSTNLTDTNAWVTLTNLTLTQPVQLWVDTSVDASSPFNSRYFYRVLPGQ